ncbi:hypothetical protein H7X65_01520 [Candidatus Parcubacteria bacterium]|nr:hypothetical protein [Candidatus Parcubacteria bacterium]
MKKIIKVIIAIVIIGGIAYYYLKQKVDMPVAAPVTPLATTTPVSIGDNMFIAATEDADATILAKGDLNNDTYVDAIVAVAFCGASCSLSLEVVLNTDNRSARAVDNITFEGYKSSSATKSDLSSVSIENGIISLTGKGLDCDDDCSDEKWTIVKTIQYKLEGSKIVRVSKPLTN